jgi:V/A-type H+/Na+-transporting ATPase subunit I
VISPMDQVMVVGRKTSAHDVLVALQSLGVVQVDEFRPDEEGLGRFALSEGDRRRKATWDRIVARSASLLELLAVPEYGPSTGKGDLPADADGIAERVDGIGESVDLLLAERAQAREELDTVETYLPLFRDLAPTLAQLEASRYLHGTVALVGSDAQERVESGLREALSGRVAFEVRPRGRQVALVIAVLRRDAAELRAALATLGIGELKLPDRYAELGVAKAVHVMEERQASLPKRLRAIEDELTKLGLQHGPRLKTMRQTALNHQSRLERLAGLGEGRYTFALQGWVPRDDRKKVVEALTKQFGKDVVITHRAADEHHDVDVPVKLENAGWVRPFETLLSLFAPPKYGNFDPTWTLAIFFPLFFGLIVGDIAFGLLFGWIAWLLRRRGLDNKALSLGVLNVVIPPRSLVPLSTIISWCAGWTIVWGYVYGEFFGNFLEYFPRGRPIFYTQEHYPEGHGLIEILLFRVEVFGPVLLIALGFGVLQVLGGWAIRVVYGFRHHDMKHVYEGLGMFTGLASLVIFATAFLTDNLNPVVTGIVAVGMLVFLICVVLARMPLMIVELISNSGNILSYLRLFAVGLAAALVASLATDLGFAISGTMPIIGPLLGLLVALVVHLVALVLKIIGYTLQPLRLQYVEFFTKFGFYESSGRPYQPFKLLGGKQ